MIKLSRMPRSKPDLKFVPVRITLDQRIEIKSLLREMERQYPEYRWNYKSLLYWAIENAISDLKKELRNE